MRLNAHYFTMTGVTTYMARDVEKINKWLHATPSEVDVFTRNVDSHYSHAVRSRIMESWGCAFARAFTTL